MTSRLKIGAKNLFNRLAYFKNMRGYLAKAEKRSILFFTCMILIITLAITIRILPLKYSFNLSEFDPYFQYDVTSHIVENGFFSWSYTINDMWFPQGRDVASTSFPGLPITGAAVYFAVSGLGFDVSVLDVCIIFPVVFAVLSCIVAYYLGKEVGGKGVGLLSALFLATNPAYISRTMLGFYDDETVGVLGILLTSLFFLRSLKQEEKWQISLMYTIAAGLGLGYVFASWGAAKYLLALLALSTFFFLIAKSYSRRLLTSYSVLILIGLSIATQVPKLGLRYLRELESVAAIGIFLLLLIYEVSHRFGEGKQKIFMVISFVGLGVIAVVLWQIGFISLPLGKFLSVLYPFERSDIPIVQSVAEHVLATWSAFYYQFGVLVFLMPLGIIFALNKTTHFKLFLTIYAITTLYFSASMIRLTVVLAPALCILGALAFVEILQPFTDIATQRMFSRRRLRIHSPIEKKYVVFLILTFFVISVFPMIRGINSANAPATITSSTLPVQVNISDWIEALTWMKENLPEHAVVASWWDYGYWISVIGDKISLADNGTFNSSQIAWIGRMFMSTEQDAISMMKDFNNYASMGKYKSDKNISHVVVFTTIGQAVSGQYLFGDEVKWRWMAKIGWNGTADELLEDYSITQQLANYWLSQTQDPNLQAWYNEFKTFALPKTDRVLTKLMLYGAFGMEEPENFQLVFSSSRSFVFIYEVNY